VTTPTDPGQDPRNTPPPSGGYGAPDPGYTSPEGGYGTPQGSYGTPATPPSYSGSPTPGAYGGSPAAASGQLAEWPLRVGSALIDYVAPFIVAAVFFLINDTLGWLLYLAAIGWAIYQAYLGGSTGQSMGKKTMNTRLLGEKTAQPIGGGMGIARYFVHIVDGIPCYLGYLWPLWDAKKQTFADKILSTVVVKA